MNASESVRDRHRAIAPGVTSRVPRSARALGRWGMALLLASGVGQSAVQAAEPAATSPPPASGVGVVKIGRREVLNLRQAQGVLGTQGRSRWANEAIADALDDPNCGPEGWAVQSDGDAFVITLCARRVLLVTDIDAEIAGRPTADLAHAWADSLRQVFGEEQQYVVSSRLLRRALIAVLYPLGFLLLVWALRAVDRRAAIGLLNRVKQHGGLHVGRLRLFTTATERAVLKGALTVIRAAVAIALLYLFAIGLLRQFPNTSDWAARLWQPIRTIVANFGERVPTLLPRIALAALVLAALRVALRATRQLFDRVRSGRLQIEPLLSRENATELEVAVRAVLLAVGAFLLALLVPGQGGIVLLAVFGLMLAAFVLGARDLTADLLGGLSAIFLRTFRTGQRIRCGEVTGLVRARGLLYTQLEAEDGDLLLLPNQRLLQQPLELIGKERVLSMQVLIAGQGGAETAPGLFHLAAAACGLKRQDGRIDLVAVRDGGIVFRVEWPIPSGQSAAELRSQFLKALMVKSSGMHLAIASAEAGHQP